MATSKKVRSMFSQLQARLNRRRQRRLRYEHLEQRYLLAVDFDGDGVMDAIEDAHPNGGDGNNDSILDSLQGNVASLPSLETGNYATLVTDVGTLANVAAVANPSPGTAPADTTFSIGFFEFDVQGVTSGGFANVEIISTDPVVFDRFWNYGPTALTSANTWYEYTAGFDGRGGVTYAGSSATLTLIDGNTGDDDLTANGVISRLGGPGVAGGVAGPDDRVEETQTITAAIAGNVADSDTDLDFLGDNKNDLPGAAPILVSAGVAQSGGAGSNGTTRIHIEWDIAGLVADIQGGDILTSASVLLHTEKGTVDSLDTFFYAANSDGNGILENSDFQTDGQIFSGVVMPVPAGPTGTEGTFSFDVTTRLQAAVDNGFDYFVIQGRVDEATLIPNPLDPPTTPQRGLQVNSTATGNIDAGLTPALTFVLNQSGDNDGVTDALESGAPNAGDGNSDGILDSIQSNVSSRPNAATGQYVTIAADTGLQLASVNVSQPSPPTAGVELPIGVVGYTLNGLVPGAATVVTIFPQSPLPAGTSYYKFGPEPSNTTPHWYEFLFDGTTGAEFQTNGAGEVIQITLHFVDGDRGDSDLTANGTIVDPGGPSVTNVAPGLTVGNATSTTGIGSTATNSGTFADALGQVVTIDSSIGSLKQDEGNSGNWTWQFGPAAGSGQNQTVTITATDNFGAQSTVTFDLVVNDSLPDVLTINVSPSSPVPEGTLVTVTGTYNTNAGTAPFIGTAVWSDGVTSPLTIDVSPANGSGTYHTSRTLDDTGTDADGASGSVTVTVTIIDASLGSDSITSDPITVTNDPPTISLQGTPDPLDEGSPYTLTLGSVQDTGDDTVTAYSVIWGDGSSDNFTVAADGPPDGKVITHVYTDGPAGLFEIVVSLTDEDGTHQAGFLTLNTVNDVAPTIGLSGADVVGVGDTYSLDLGSVIDPGDDTVTGYAVNWDDGTTVETFIGRPDGKTLAHTYAAPRTATISISLTNEDGTFANAGTKTIAVTDTPVVTADHDEVIVNEGGVAANMGTFADNDSNVVLSASVGTVTQSPDPGSSGTWNWSFSTTDGPTESQLVKITATDGFGASSSISFALVVNNVAPTANAGADQTVSEGDTVNLDGSFTDPGSNDTHTFLWEVSSDNGQVIADGTSEDFSFVPIDDGTYTLTYTVTDDDGDEGSDTVVVTVNNANPVIVSAATDATFAEKANPGDLITFTATFTDAGIRDTHTATISWGDEGPNDPPNEPATVTETDGSGTVTASHTYSGGGIFTITVTVIDDDTGEATATTTAVVTGVRLVNGELQVVGTDVKDTVKMEIKSDGGADFLQVDAKLGGSDGSFDDKVLFPLDDVTSILAHLCDGDDQLEINKDVEIDAVVFGDGGEDTIKGGGGNDQLFGGDAKDEIDGRGGDDQIFGGDGPDKLRGGTDGGDDELFGGGGNDELNGDDGDDLLVGGVGDDKLEGKKGDDQLFGDDGNDVLKGGSDGDQLFGGGGDDELDAGKGADILVGDAGDDKLEGGDDADLLIGGIGADNVNGKNGGDVLIGGSTTDDDDPLALAAVLDAWTSATDYPTGVAAVDALLTVIDDNNADKLKGEGGRDLFFNGSGDDLDDVEDDETILPPPPESEGSVSPYQNSINSLDVDESGGVSALDVLLVYNYLNANGSGVLSGTTNGKIDVNGDRSATPLDALLIINFLNSDGTVLTEGEGGSTSTALPSASVASSSRQDADIPGGSVVFVVTTDLSGTTVQSDFDEDLLSKNDSELAATADDYRPVPSTAAAASSTATRRFTALDEDELGLELDELAEDLAGIQEVTAHELFFGRFV